jgi:Zn-dependent protease with chaperone function
MRFEEFRNLIRRLEAEAARDPKRYALRVGLFGVLGYGYVLGVFALLGAAVFAVPHLSHGRSTLLVVHPLLLMVPIAIVLGRVVVVRVPEPRGVPLTRERAPALFARIDEVARVLRAPRPQRVLLTPDFDCAAMQRPRLGIFGWNENVLLLGLPMLETLSPARFRAVLAHELGHLAADHGSFGGRMHAISDVWGRMLGRLQVQRGPALFAFERFFRWYGPRFRAMGFVLGRRQEHFADLCSRRVAGGRATRGALVRIQIMARWHSEIRQQTLHAPVRDSDAPPKDAIAEIARRMREDPPADRAARWLEEAMRTETGYENTHPALRDRLAAIDPGAVPTIADTSAEPGPSAAQELLGAALEALTREAGDLWVEHWAEAWKARHHAVGVVAHAPAPPAAVSGEAAPDPPSRDAAWRALSARLEFTGEEGAAAALAAFLEAHPNHAPAHYRLGRVLLRDGDARGLAELERAMELDPDAIPACCDVAKDFLRAQGKGEEADAYTRRWWEWTDLLARSEEERRFLRRKERLEPSGLAPAAVAALRERVAAEPWIAAAYLARKDVELLPERPCYVLGLRVHRPWYKYADPKREARAVHALLADDAIPAGTWTFVLEGDLRWARSRFERVEGAKFWTRPKHRSAAAAPARRTQAA